VCHKLCVEIVAPMDGPSLKELCLAHCKVHKVLDKAEADESAKLCEVGKAYLIRKAKALVHSAEGRAVLYTYGSDATSAKCAVTYTAKVSPTKRVHRRGSQGVELLVERAFLKTATSSGEGQVVCLWKEPTPLLHGKTALVHFSAACRLFPLVRALDHRGIVVSHYCFDRALQAPMARKMQQRHSLYYETLGGPIPRQGEIALLELQDWVVNTACSAHDVHNSLMWGLRPYAGNEADMMRKLHVAIGSLRNSYDLLHRFLNGFVARHLQFDEEEADHDKVYAFWLALSVEEDIAKILADLDLRWDGNALWVAERHRTTPDVVEKVSACMLAVFKFREFTASRWLTVGIACRSLIGALAVGLRPLVAMIRADPSASDYYMHGFAEVDGTLHYATVAGVASHVCDAVLLALLADDRMATRQEKYKEVIARELQQVSHMSDYAWGRLSKLLGECTAKSLKSDCIQAALASAAFLQMRMFSAASKYPWKLCSGDIDANLQALAEHDTPTPPHGVE
jgi:hypothetical protein